MPIARKHLPSPLTGEGAGGGGTGASPPHPHLPPPRGEGVLTPTCELPSGGNRWGKTASAFHPYPRSLHQGGGNSTITLADDLAVT
jgi:hypothetical protein